VPQLKILQDSRNYLILNNFLLKITNRRFGKVFPFGIKIKAFAPFTSHFSQFLANNSEYYIYKFNYFR